MNSELSKMLKSSTGFPQRCVLFPQLYIHTKSCYSHHDNRYIIKFVDYSIINSLLSAHEIDHGPFIDDFVSWCENAFLHLNISKVLVIIIDTIKEEIAHLKIVNVASEIVRGKFSSLAEH